LSLKTATLDLDLFSIFMSIWSNDIHIYHLHRRQTDPDPFENLSQEANNRQLDRNKSSSNHSVQRVLSSQMSEKA